MLESLEDRFLLYAATGDHFAFNSRITWSIMPDGTSIGGTPSNLIATLNQEMGTNNWIQPLYDAFAQWESSSNVNLAPVSDNGAPFGSGGYQQGDPGFGDIRIGGYVQNNSVLAFTVLPPGDNGGSDAGDILLNTAQSFHLNSDYDFESIIEHEIGHAVAGLGESLVTSAVGYGFYNGIKQSLTGDDIAGIQALWGTRAEDSVEQSSNNLTSSNAYNTTGLINGNGQVVLPSLNVASSGEQYWFKVTTPANASSTFTAQVQSTNLSELSPRVAIYNSSLQGLMQTIAPSNAYGATISATINNATPNTTYYIKVLGSNGGDSGTGAYALTLNTGRQPIAAVAPPNTTVAAQPDQGGGASLEQVMPGAPAPRKFAPIVPSTSIPAQDPIIPIVTEIKTKAPSTTINVPKPLTINWSARLKSLVTQDQDLQD